MTREVLSRMPQNVVSALNSLKKDYNNPAIDHDVTLARIAGYVKGLRDAGLISERDRQVLLVYATV